MIGLLDEHPGFARVFGSALVEHRLTLGVFFAIEAYSGDTPTMRDQERLARRAEELGFAALWVRDVPLRDPSFGDVGQIYDPFAYLGWIAAQTREIALVTGAIVLPLRHPLHVAKAAASLDVLSSGRLILGVATGDRPGEARAFGIDVHERASYFREYLEILRRAWSERFPEIDARTCELVGLDPIPKPRLGGIPTLVVGRSGQSLDWIARSAEGFVTYPRTPEAQSRIVSEYRAALRAASISSRRHVAQSLYVDLVEDRRAGPRPIHLGWSLGRDALVDLLDAYERAGIDHVALNLKYSTRPAAEVLEEVGAEILPWFHGGAVTAGVG